MAHYHMLPNIRAHSLRVRDVALILGRQLHAVGVGLNLPLLEAGALLHDIAKTACLANGGQHAQLGAQWLAEQGYPAVAEIVREHVWLSRHPAEPWPLREVEIVNYADKRVLHDQVVSLRHRFADLRRRYGRTPEILARLQQNEERSLVLEAKIFARLQQNEERSLVLEAKIFAHLQHTPADLADLIAYGGGNEENPAGSPERR